MLWHIPSLLNKVLELLEQYARFENRRGVFFNGNAITNNHERTV